MMIKAEINEKPVKKEKPFPKLMQNIYGDIVLFYKEYCGTSIYGLEGTGVIIGEYSYDYAMEHFTDFDGTITLSNGGDDE